MSKLRRHLFVFVGLSLFLLGDGGCSSDSVQSQVAAMNSSNIKRIANLFAACQNANGGQGPKDVETIKAFAKGIPPDALQNMKIDGNNLDVLFTSERDQKPFKIKFGAYRSMMAPHIPVVFEVQGIDGKKQVAWTNAQVRDVDDAEYQQLWGEKSAPTPTRPPGGESASGDAAKGADKK